jgi:TonB family protein
MVLWIIYLIGLIVVAAPLFIHALRLYRLTRRSEGKHDGAYYIIESKPEQATYSFFRLIFIGTSEGFTSNEKELVILHEKYHGRALHTLDIIFATSVCLLFWFNPIVWLYRRDLVRVHEYEADNFVTARSSSKDYSLLLAKSALIGSGFPFTHNISQAFILKRINMLNKMKKAVNSWKLLTVAIALVSYAVLVSCTDQVAQSESQISQQEILMPQEVSDQLAVLRKINPAGDYEALKLGNNDLKSLQQRGSTSLEFIMVVEPTSTWVIVNKNGRSSEALTAVEHSAAPIFGINKYYESLAQVLRYPESAMQMGIEGKVFVEFIVENDGRLSNYKILRGLSPDCDAAALSAIMVLGKWNPAIQDGKAVAQKMVLPITFKLN